MHRCQFLKYKGYYNPATGRVKFGNHLFPDIHTAVKFLSKKYDASLRRRNHQEGWAVAENRGQDLCTPQVLQGA